MQERPVLIFNLQGNVYDVLCLQFILITLNNSSLLSTQVMPYMQRSQSTSFIGINFHRTLTRKTSSNLPVWNFYLLNLYLV